MTNTSDVSQASDAAAASTTEAASTTRKRKRWGSAATPAVSSTPADLVSDALHQAMNAHAVQRAAQSQLLKKYEFVSRKLWVLSTRTQKPVAHFVRVLEPGLFELQMKQQLDAAEQALIVKEIYNNEDSSKEKSRLLLELRGRGSNSAPPPVGIPQEPLHVALEGPACVVTASEESVEKLLFEAENAPVDPDIEEQERQQQNTLLQNSANGTSKPIVSGRAMDADSLALVVAAGMENPTLAANQARKTAYRPASVAQLIGQVVYDQPNDGSGQTIDEEVYVPNNMVGYIIGRGGENISSMQVQTGVKVQVQKELEIQPGQTHRIIYLSSPNPDALAACRKLIENMVHDRGGKLGTGIRATDALSSHPGIGFQSSSSTAVDARVAEAVAAGHVLLTVDIDDVDVGYMIGKQGTTIRQIQDQTGASIQVPTSQPGVPKRTISITHPTAEGAEQAKQVILETVSRKKSANAPSTGNQITVQIPIPDHSVGLCIGRQGNVIKAMQAQSGASIQIPSQPVPGQTHRLATVTGSQQACQLVQQMIDRIVAEQSSASVVGGGGMMGGGVQGSYYQAQPHASAAGAPASAEWAAYYAAQAQQQEQYQPYQVQQQQSIQQQAVQSEPAPGMDAYYEQFFRYSYYYGEDAARQHYGAWAPPVGTPNPYGVNPAGIQPVPPAEGSVESAAAPADAAAPPQHAQAQEQQARDSSQRKVSNLPAWMMESK
jgi:far upstream element-binding protein